ncbi:MAG: heme-dependent oxidative N-demethylase subunit alpha family protein [Verrucomicrobiota bacterium]
MDSPFPSPEFAWSLRMRKAAPELFFAKQDHSGELLREKNHWLDTLGEHCLVETEKSGEFAAQLWALARDWGQVKKGEEKSLEALSRVWECDLIFLDAETFRVAGGCVCFPSSWSLAGATGKTLGEVHGIVPGLNEAIGGKIHRFLSKLAPGKAYHRANWGMTRSDELNYHPALERERLDDTVTWNDLFLRLEHQSFLRLDGGIVLAVRIEPIALETLRLKHPEVLSHLKTQLATMPRDVARYKSLEESVGRIVELIEEKLE